MGIKSPVSSQITVAGFTIPTVVVSVGLEKQQNSEKM